MKLTKRTIDSLRNKPDSLDKIFWDSELAGFGLRRKPSGSMTWMIQYRNRGAVSRRLSLGDAAILTPAEARTIARRELALVKEGHDPVHARRESRAILSFDELVEDYRKENASWLERGESSRRTDEGRIRAHLHPLLGPRRLNEINQHRMELTFRAIRDGATADDHPSRKHGRSTVTGGAGAARRTMALASAIFAHGVRRGFIGTNPCTGIATGRDGQRDTILENAEGYERLFSAISELDKAGTISGASAEAISLIALTGARRGEVVGLTWGNVDLGNGRIVLQAHQHKSGWKTSKPKIIALPAVAVEILKSMTPGAPEELVLRSAREGSRIDLKGPWARIKTAAGLDPSLTLHGLRHSVASHLAMGGATGPEIQAAMGHANIQTSARYIHFASSRKNELAERAASVASAGLAASRVPKLRVIK